MLKGPFGGANAKTDAISLPKLLLLCKLTAIIPSGRAVAAPQGEDRAKYHLGPDDASLRVSAPARGILRGVRIEHFHAGMIGEHFPVPAFSVT